LLFFFISFSCCFAFSHTYAASLDSTIQQKLGSSNVSVSVRTVDNGEIIYQKMEILRLNLLPRWSCWRHQQPSMF